MDPSVPATDEAPIHITCRATDPAEIRRAVEREIRRFDEWLVATLDGQPMHSVEHAILRTYLQLRLLTPATGVAETASKTA